MNITNNFKHLYSWNGARNMYMLCDDIIWAKELVIVFTYFIGDFTNVFLFLPPPLFFCNLHFFFFLWSEEGSLNFIFLRVVYSVLISNIGLSYFRTHFWVSFPFFSWFLHLRTKLGVCSKWVGYVNSFSPRALSHVDGCQLFSLFSFLSEFFLPLGPSSNHCLSCSNHNVNYRFPRDESKFGGKRVLSSPCDLLSMKVNLLVNLK